ncbi:hypothetical protein Tco_1322442, partial [Tanacetum coccineum]
MRLITMSSFDIIKMKSRRSWEDHRFEESGGDVFDLIGDVDPTDEDGDIGMGDSTGVSASLGGEIFSGGKKCHHKKNREPLSEDILGATTERDTRSYYPKRYWELLPKEILELLPKEILGATTQRDTESYYPKRYWELLPKEILGATTQRDTK